MKLKHILPALLAGFLFPALSFSQIDDIGLWGGLSIDKQLTRQLNGSVTEQIRFNHDVTTIDVLLTDIGLEYAFTKALHGGIHYRFINSNQENYYSKRHRFYIDLSYKYKFDFLSLTLRERVQEQFTDYNSSETGKIPVWTLRSKLTAKFDLDKKYTPYISGEAYYLIDDADEQDQRITRFRYEVGFNYQVNRIHGFNPFILFQHSRSPLFDELIYGVVYSLSF